MKEIWKDIIGYKGLYKISNLGSVYSIRRDIILSPIINKGRMRVHLYKNNKIKTKNIYRILALHFIPNPKNYRCINHIDGNPLNDDISNLEWCTHSQNIQHAYDTGLKRIPLGEINPNNKFNESLILKIRKLRELGLTYKLISEKFKMKLDTVGKICQKRVWKHI